jgi:hypothetical protein
MDGYIVGSMISANSITGEQIQANSIKTANLELSAQQKIQNATDEETVKALIKADLDGFESTLSKEFITVENATTQIQQATEVAVKEATQSIIDNAVTESMGAVDGQLNDKLNQYTGNTLLPAIAEKAEEVLQNAEDYVVTKLESYATKQELSSSISQTREQIELSVSEKYTTKTESATIITEAIDGITVGAINRALGTGENKSFKFNGGANETWLPYKFSNDISDKEAYVSFNYTLTGTAQNGSQIEFAPSYLKKANNQTVYRPKHIFFTSNRLQDVNITDTVSFTTKDFQDISPSSTNYIRFVGNGFTGTLSISEVQIKPGNSKTSWSPAPEDVNNDIVNAKNEAIISANNTLISTIANHYTKSETDSKISVAKDEINLGVSNKYETKANVETKVSSTLSSAKSYADTKKTEAINSAASDATSKVNAAKSELNTAIGKKANTVDVYSKAEVYTKEQTDSAIKIAKDEIKLGVSNTYETKTNVETKIEAIQVGGTNLVKQSKLLTDVTSLGGWYTAETGNEGFKKLEIVTTDANWQECSVPLYTEINTITKAVTISFEYQETTSELLLFSLGTYNGGTRLAEIPNVTVSSGFKVISTNNGWKTVYCTFDPTSINGQREANQYRIQFKKVFGKTGTINVRKLKLEVGTKATTWSPAPEDVTNDITNAKTEAIDTASADATSKVNSAKNELNTEINKKANSADVYKKTEVYTKNETNSQITTAKNEINLEVSNTYETKTNVETKINTAVNNVQVGGRNLWRFTKEYDGTKYNGWVDNNDAVAQAIAPYTTVNGFGVQRIASIWKDISQRVAIEANTDYTLSAWIKWESTAGSMMFYTNTGTMNDTDVTSQVGTTDYKRVSITFNSGNATVSTCRFECNSDTPYLIYGLKLEKGTKATDWTPAPEDIENEMTILESETKTLKESVSSLQLNSDSISASVKSLQETVTNTTNGLSEDIQSVQNQVDLMMTSDQVKLEIQKEMSKGANKVSTSTGFTFNDNGLNISKSDSEMSTQITEDGMKVYRNNDIVLTANNQGVDAKNLHATTYLIIGGNSRMEDVVENNVKRTAVFWIGN